MVLLRLRIAVVGAPTSGKTAFVQMLHSNGASFPKNYLMTMGCDLVVKEITLDDGNVVEVSFLDIGGQKIYERMTPAYLEAASAFIVMYDVSNKSTFEACERWVDKIRKLQRDLPLVLVANKSDLSDKSEVSNTQGEAFAKAYKMKFYKCSALRGIDINEPVVNLAQKFSENYQKRVEQLARIS